MSPVEVCYGLFGKEVGVADPRVVRHVIPFPFDHVPEVAPADLGFQDFLDLPFLVAVFQLRARFIVTRPPWEGFGFCKLQLDDGKDGVEMGEV